MRAALALLFRQGATNGLAAGAGILLARMLVPADFGLFAVATFVMSFVGVFADAGLAASLVRQVRTPDPHEIRSVFTLQQILVAGMVALLWVASPFLAEAYSLSPDKVWFFRALSFTLFIGSFQTIPSLLLERELGFSKLAQVEVFQSLVYHGSAVLCAWQGLGVWSFAVAGILRALVGAAILNVMRPWPIGFAWDWAVAAPRLRFGLMLQGGSLVNLSKDAIVPLYIGLLAGPGAVGLVGWAGMIAAYPILALMPLGRLYFPVFARLQTDRAALGRAMERIIGWTNRIAAPVTVVMVVLADPMIRIVYTDKWLPAMDLLRLLAFANVFSATSTPCLGLLNGLGLAKHTFRMSLLWMACTWIVGIPAILWAGPIGFGIANLAATAINLHLFQLCRREADFRIIAPIAFPWLAALFAGVSSWAAAWLIHPDELWELLACGAVGGMVYLALIAWREGATLHRDWKQLRKGSAS
ncbi:MAG: oligosaccharide flippase family protein [Fibrobacteria bacterium]|nr:oligosaccharide flippase family protein [Fibrobacteria bacterium]